MINKGTSTRHHLDGYCCQYIVLTTRSYKTISGAPLIDHRTHTRTHTHTHICTAHRHIPCSNEYSYTTSSSLPLYVRTYLYVCMNLITPVTSTSPLVSWTALDSSWTTSFSPCFRSPWTPPPTLSCTASCNRWGETPVWSLHAQFDSAYSNRHLHVYVDGHLVCTSLGTFTIISLMKVAVWSPKRLNYCENLWASAYQRIMTDLPSHSGLYICMYPNPKYRNDVYMHNLTLHTQTDSWMYMYVHDHLIRTSRSQGYSQ